MIYSVLPAPEIHLNTRQQILFLKGQRSGEENIWKPEEENQTVPVHVPVPADVRETS